MLSLLQLFASEATVRDYESARARDAASLPELNEKMRRKLQLLTVLTLCARSESKRVPYALLLAELGLGRVAKAKEGGETKEVGLAKRCDSRRFEAIRCDAMRFDARRGDTIIARKKRNPRLLNPRFAIDSTGERRGHGH